MGQPLPADQGRSEARARRTIKWLAASLLILLVVVIRTLAPSATVGIEAAARDFFTLSIRVIIESLPFLFLGILVSILVQIWMPEDFLLRRLPRNPVLRRMALSLLVKPRVSWRVC